MRTAHARKAMPSPLTNITSRREENENENSSIVISHNGSLRLDSPKGSPVSVRTTGVFPAAKADVSSSPVREGDFDRSMSGSLSISATRPTGSSSSRILTSPVAPMEGSSSSPTSGSGELGSSLVAVSSTCSNSGLCSPREDFTFRWEDVEVGEVVGEGSQGKVLVAQVRNSEAARYALKVIQLGKKEVTKKSLQAEVAQVLSFRNARRHANVVTSFEAFFDKGKRELKILMEYMDLGTVKDVLSQVGPFPEDILSCVTHQTLLGLEFLHGCNTLHRDLKPSNLLINTAGVVKVADFGLSKVLDSQLNFASTYVGTSCYMSPERVKLSSYGAKADVWSVGITVAECALGVYPLFCEFPEDDLTDPFEVDPKKFDMSAYVVDGQAKVHFDILLRKIRQFRPRFPVQCVEPSSSTASVNGPNVVVDEESVVVSSSVQDFVRQCMAAEEGDRPTCKELLAHALITRCKGKANLKAWLSNQGESLKPLLYSG